MKSHIVIFLGFPKWIKMSYCRVANWFICRDSDFYVWSNGGKHMESWPNQTATDEREAGICMVVFFGCVNPLSLGRLRIHQIYPKIKRNSGHVWFPKGSPKVMVLPQPPKVRPKSLAEPGQITLSSRNCLERKWTSKESAHTQFDSININQFTKNVQGVANHSNRIQSLKRRIKNMAHVTCASVWDCASQSDSTGENNKQNVDHGLLNPLAQRQGCRVWGQIGQFKRRIYGKPLFLHVLTLKFRSFGKFLPSSDLGIGWGTSEHKLQSFDFGYQRLSRPSANLPWVRVKSLSTPNTSQH